MRSLDIYRIAYDYLVVVSSEVVSSQVLSSDRVRQDVLPPKPPQSRKLSRLWKLLPLGRLGSRQWWADEGTNISAVLPASPEPLDPDIINPEYQNIERKSDSSIIT